MKLINKEESDKLIIGFHPLKGSFRGEYLHQLILMGGVKVKFRPGISGATDY